MSNGALKIEGKAQPDILRWYAIETEPQRELHVQEGLRRSYDEDDIFLPVRERRKHRPGSPVVLVPLISRIVFLRSAMTDAAWSLINRTFGVRGVLRMAGVPTPVRPEAMDAFRNAIVRVGQNTNGAYVVDPVQVGARLRLLGLAGTDGPIEGTCVGRDADRVWVMAVIFGFPQRVPTTVSRVEAV